MKMFGYQIVGGPNLSFWFVTAGAFWMSYKSASFLPIGLWLGFCVLLIPLCLWLHKWNRRQNQKMLDDFPDDPFIQRKYRSKV